MPEPSPGRCRLAAIGIAVGIAAAAATTRPLTTLLVGVTPLDARTLTGVAALLGMIALVASYVPIRRAASLDPLTRASRRIAYDEGVTRRPFG